MFEKYDSQFEKKTSINVVLRIHGCWRTMSTLTRERIQRIEGGREGVRKEGESTS